MIQFARRPMRDRIIRRGWPVKLNITPLACGGPAAGMMRNSCVIVRKTQGKSTTDGAVTTTWTQTYTVCCSVQAKVTREDEQGERENPGYSFNVYFPPAADIQFGDRLYFPTGPVGLTGRTLEVDGYPIDNAGMAAYLKVTAIEVQGNDA